MLKVGCSYVYLNRPVHLSKCRTCNTKELMNTPNTFSVVKENIRPHLFVILKHSIKWSKLIKQKATNKDQLC